MVANGLEGVPWYIGGGAEHSPNVARVLAHAATSGASGIVTPGDLKVVPSSPTPNNQIHMGVGALAIVSRSANVQSESYIARAPQVTDITITPTGSSGRSDLLVVRVKDPQFAPWGPAPDLESGPYVFPEIIPGVAANTTRVEQLNLPQALYAPARIDIPPNTTNITAAMIKDLRELISPHNSIASDIQAPPNEQTLTTSMTSFVDWPTNVFNVKIPNRATTAIVVVRGAAMGFGAGPANGNGSADAHLRVLFNGQPDGTRFSILDHNAHAQQVQADGLLLPWSVYGEFDVTALRGQTVPIKVQGRRVWEGITTGKLITNGAMSIEFEVRFSERVV